MTQRLSIWTCAVLLSQTRALILPLSLPAAPPDYSSVVTEEEAGQCSTAVVPQPAEDLSGILERPLMAFVQEFRFRPPPVYSEVSHQTLESTCTLTHGVAVFDWHIQKHVRLFFFFPSIDTF